MPPRAAVAYDAPVRPGLAAEEEERAYRQERFAEYATLSRNVSVAGAVLILVLWLRVYAHDPANAFATLPLRLLMVAAVGLYCAALLARLRRAVILACGYAAIVVVEFAIMAMWSGLSAGYVASFPAYLFVFLITPLILLPFSFRESASALLLVPIVPNVQIALGMAPDFPALGFNAMIWPACAMALFVQFQFDALSREVFRTRRSLDELARRDALTGLGNRRHLVEHGTDLLAVAQRHGRPLGLLMLDVDHFKQINDRHGHAAGDDVLRFLGATIPLYLRATDVVGRTGGEEFAIVLPETGAAVAAEAAERLCAAIAAVAVPCDAAPHPISITISVGVAGADSQTRSFEALLARADRALYRAKREGRNRVCRDSAQEEALAEARPRPAGAADRRA